MKYKVNNIVKVIEIDGKRLIFTEARNQFQCAKCLWLYDVVADPDNKQEENGDRTLIIEGECYCDKKQV